MQLKQESESANGEIDPRRVLVVFALYLFAFIWLISGIATKYHWLYNLFRPHLPNWALLVLGLTAPITMAIVGLRPIPWKISVVFMVVLLVQGALLGLVGEKYRYVQAGVTAFAFLEAYIILPKLNRILAKENDSRVLHLE